MASRVYWIMLGLAAILGLAPWIAPVAFLVQMWIIADRFAQIGRSRWMALWAPALATLMFIVPLFGFSAYGAITGLDRGNDGYGLMGGMIGMLAAWIGFNGVGVWAGLLRPRTEPLAAEQA